MEHKTSSGGLKERGGGVVCSRSTVAIGVENLQICWKYDQREVMSDFDSPVFDLKQSANTVKAYHTTPWIGLPRAQTLTLLKQCLIILMENQKKRALNALLLTL